MNRTCLLITVTLLGSAAIPAQIQPGLNAYSQSYAQLQQTLDNIDSLRLFTIGSSVPALRAEAGRPFSATATTQTVQAFPDGMHITHSTSLLEYRDADGRTRTENLGKAPFPDPGSGITIRDPIAGVTYNLDPGTKSGRKIVMQGRGGGPSEQAGGRGGRGRGAATNTDDIAEAAKNSPNNLVEDLGVKTVNGVPARGTRVTTVVPSGAIGNDREFRSVSERWFSADLNMLIKSVSTDPRFGTTAYDLTNISRQTPDAALFRPPSDYEITPQ
jgi:hypothetical protein